MPVQERLRKVFVSALELGPEVDVDHLAQRVDPNWDSVGHMALVVAIEDEFGVEFAPTDVIAMDSFEAAVRIVGELADGGGTDPDT
jgi:acyl carrier protein